MRANNNGIRRLICPPGRDREKIKKSSLRNKTFFSNRVYPVGFFAPAETPHTTFEVYQSYMCSRSCLCGDLHSFWTNAFAYSSGDISEVNSILSLANLNLSSSEKELLLWHQHLSHINLAWLQTFMWDRKWLEDKQSMTSLHSGPFIVSLSWAPTCDVCSLKCSLCLCAKATTCTTKVTSVIPTPAKRKVLKCAHLEPGHCISVDHYMSPEMGRLPHTF
jgi:hypothetical protein